MLNLFPANSSRFDFENSIEKPIEHFCSVRFTHFCLLNSIEKHRK